MSLIKNGDDYDLWLMQKMNRPHLYVLDKNDNPVPASSPFDWAIWFEEAERRVQVTETDNRRVSTVFLGVDMAMDGPPVFWETMLSDMEGRHLDCSRCGGSRKDALQMHKEVCDGIVSRLLDLA